VSKRCQSRLLEKGVLAGDVSRGEDGPQGGENESRKDRRGLPHLGGGRGTWLRNSSGTILNKHVYAYNTGGQRSQQTRQDVSYVNYGYDNDAQLQSALGYTSGGTPITNETLGFTYDASWNLTPRTRDGTPTSYPVNDLNNW